MVKAGKRVNASASKTADEIVRAAYEMGAVRTGALIVIEQDMVLEDMSAPVSR